MQFANNKDIYEFIPGENKEQLLCFEFEVLCKKNKNFQLVVSYLKSEAWK